ncbi:dense granular protein GRA10 [Toxoplasma gondii TgCatPRC2]|uniref:Dense granular protein GRA10 n=4 Tax=Toxoplasma gondii TaxID=5811 RepID=A0A151HNN3_TOXGO|nr:dense granular protein GRA10 [Toxoplasma gondii ME49]EPT28280.1 dense granular protein GRA10 [Toxoplasma gondii ME49]KYF47156.1 dense granular protein GRA10 [Toxoplasma gondii ARI]KYK70874.1 dense granular protein GRA10 [Toxoplasma gondii TgCatPRC2]PIM01018.1 dense granular protein GRA10 [Toxoplasma gondii COUG]|eukprot:XP_002365583.1 dense granular protein GRA10 [Toxoplasma gondii ME49]
MMLLYYRLSSEHAGSYRQCPLSCSALSLAEVKQLLAARCGLANEYGRKIDFRIFLAGSQVPGGAAEAEELTEIVDENQMIHAYSKVVLQRVAITYGGSGQSVLHKARSELSQEEWKTAEERKLSSRLKRLPPEWLCGLCHRVMTNPVLVRCATNCAQSACHACLEAHLGPNRICPFCNSPFRQAIRNKRLQEIIALANLSEFESAPGAACAVPQLQVQAYQAGDPASSAVAPGEGSRSTDLIRSACREGPSDASRLGSGESHSATGAGVADRVSGGNVCEDRETDDDVGADGSRGDSAGASDSFRSEADWVHFVYLVPQENLKLMRQYDMMVVESSSNLAVALVRKATQRGGSGNPDAAAELGEPAEGALRDGTGNSGPTTATGETEQQEQVRTTGSKNTDHEVFVVPLCSAGGGTSFSIAGFARINSARQVDPEADSAAATVVQQWQSSSGRASNLPGHGAGLAFGVYRISWDNKFNPMPMLPSRKQPLCSLLGAHRRQFHSNASGVPAVPGLLKREVFGGAGAGMIEAAVEAAKYEEVLACIKDYAQFGSRPAEPWQHPASQTSSAAAATPGLPKKGVPVGGIGQEGSRVPPPPPPPPGSVGESGFSLSSGNGVSVVEKRDVSSEGRGPSDGVSISFNARGASLPGSLGDERKALETGVFGIPVSLGPPSLGLRGDPGEPSNPYLGYCALLPLLTEEQFRHIRRLQKRAMVLCGYTQSPPESRKKRRRSGKKKRGKHSVSSHSTGSGTLPSDEPVDGCDRVREEAEKEGTGCMSADAPAVDTNTEALSIQNAATSVTRQPLSDPDSANATGSRVRAGRRALPRVPPVLKISRIGDKNDTDTTQNKDTGSMQSQRANSVIETCSVVEENTMAKIPGAEAKPEGVPDNGPCELP